MAGRGMAVLLLAASLLVPTRLWGAAVWLAYRPIMDGLRVRATSMANLLLEHAQKVFESHELALRLIDEHVGTMAWTEIHRLRSVHAKGQDGLYVSAPFTGRLTGDLALNSSLPRRDPQGGILIAALRPGYFLDFYERVLPGSDRVIGLVKDNGSVLVRFPAVPGSEPIRLAPQTGLMQAITQAPAGEFTSVAQVDAVGRDWVSIVVADTGHGIPADIRGHLFEPFFSTKGDRAGTGLGLSQVYGFVQQAGGIIRLADTQQRGTRFALLLPRYRSED